MLVKIDLGEGLSYMLLEKVQNLVYSDPNTFARVRSTKETLDAYMDCLFGVPLENPNPIKDGTEIWRSYDSAVWQCVPENTPCEKHKRVWIGRTYANEKFSVKRLSFVSDETHYEVATECPVYICDDNGKTIERIK